MRKSIGLCLVLALCGCSSSDVEESSTPLASELGTVVETSENPIDVMSDEQWRKTVAVNLDSIFAVVKHSVAQMKQQQRGGHIVLISSTAGQRGEAGHADYAATKGALISVVKIVSRGSGLVTRSGPSRPRNASSPPPA